MTPLNYTAQTAGAFWTQEKKNAKAFAKLAGMEVKKQVPGAKVVATGAEQFTHRGWDTGYTATLVVTPKSGTPYHVQVHVNYAFVTGPKESSGYLKFPDGTVYPVRRMGSAPDAWVRSAASEADSMLRAWAGLGASKRNPGAKRNPSSPDDRVIAAFLDQRPASSKKLSSTGWRLDGNWMGGSGIAKWESGKIVFGDLGSKAAQSWQRKVAKAAPKNWLLNGRGW